jgi:thiamine-monophosphate kinase
MTSEFDLIDRYFSRSVSDARIAVGDDAAVVEPAPGHDLVITTDTLVSGVHFFPDVAPRALGHKALAVNLSDLAAMGARPRWALLAVTLSKVDESWLSDFSGGFYDLAQRFGVSLIGGDTTHGPLSITVTVLGEVVAGTALRRDRACIGDEVWVSGQLGSAALALQHLRGDMRLKGKDLEACLARLEMPTPRVELGRELVDVASSAIDVSDGLIADAGHLCRRSGVAMEIAYDDVPGISEVLHLKGDRLVREALLAGGDDYELLFTAPSAVAPRMNSISARVGLALTRIGRVVAGGEVRVLDQSGSVIGVDRGGYDHFV